MRRPSLGRITSKLNAEKAVLAMASVWFLATGAKLLHGPELPEWGPPRTFDRAGEVAGVDLDKAAPFPKGGREDIFGWPQSREEKEAVAPRERRGIEIEKKRQAKADDGDKRRPDVTTEDVKDSGKGRGRKTASHERVPPRFVGTLSVEDSGTYTFVAEGNEHVAIAPGGGEAGRYRVVNRTATSIILRDSSGRLHRVAVP